jgi:hypothetical protein
MYQKQFPICLYYRTGQWKPTFRPSHCCYLPLKVQSWNFQGWKSSVALMLQYWNTYQLSWSREATFLLPSG